MERVQRAEQIAAWRAQPRPRAWAAIAKDVGLSVRQCQDLRADFLRWDDARDTPVDAIRETVYILTGALERLAETEAAAGPGTSARVGAIRSIVDTAVTRLAIMQAARMVPLDLGAEREMADARELFRQVAEVLREANVDESVLRQLREIGERRLRRPGVIEGRALPAGN